MTKQHTISSIEEYIEIVCNQHSKMYDENYSYYSRMARYFRVAFFGLEVYKFQNQRCLLLSFCNYPRVTLK